MQKALSLTEKVKKTALFGGLAAVMAASSCGGWRSSTVVGQVRDVILEGEMGSYTIGGSDYVVKARSIKEGGMELVVGENAEGVIVAEGETKKIAPSLCLTVIDILYQDFAGGIKQAEFRLTALDSDSKCPKSTEYQT